MEKYNCILPNSTVMAFHIQHEFITVQFKNNEQYQYSYRSAGKNHIETMKLLARAGWGLDTYIEQVVKHGYAKQLA